MPGFGAGPVAIGVALPVPTRLAELARRHGGRVDEAALDRLVVAVVPITAARPDTLSPLTHRRHVADAHAGEGPLLVDESLAPFVEEGRRWVHPYATWALACLLEELAPAPDPDDRRSAHIAPGVRLEPEVCVGAGAVLLGDAVIGRGTVVEPNAVVYGNVRIGARVRIGAGAVLGRQGFGWAEGPGGARRRIPQLGGVVVEDDVEIGPLATVDAGTLAPTVVGRGAKLDAHVHVGHNVVVGPLALVAAQSGFAGSVHLGAGVWVGGQVGVADHVTVGDGARLAAKAGVIGDVPAGRVVAGYPAVERSRWLRAMARLLRTK